MFMFKIKSSGGFILIENSKLAEFTDFQRKVEKSTVDTSGSKFCFAETNLFFHSLVCSPFIYSLKFAQS